MVLITVQSSHYNFAFIQLTFIHNMQISPAELSFHEKNDLFTQASIFYFGRFG